MHIQEPPIYHGDLNSWNVLIDSNLNAVLGGFGGSRSLGGDMNDLLTSGPPAGVLRFMSPELILGEDKGRDLASDIWAWGCTVFHILTDIEPFAAANERSSAVVMLALSRGQIPAQPDKLLDLLATGPAPEYASTLRLLHSYLPLCWAIEPGKRPTISLLNRQTLGSLVERALDDPIAKTLQEFVHMLIPPERLQIAEESELGAGTYGEVLLGTLDGSSPSPQDVAVKRLKAVGTRGERIRLAKRLARELNIWAKIDHPNIVKLIGYYLDDKYQSPLLISELMINGNVLSYIRRYNPHIQQRISFARGITAGLACLHRFDPAVCHADLKPENVLIDLQMNAVLCDFGLSSFVSSENSPGLATSTTVKGTQRYMPPEYHLDETGGYTHSLESDVWAWGCTVFEVLTGLVPYAEAPADGLFYLAMVQKKAPGDTTLLLSEYHEGTDNESTVALQFLHSSLPRCWDFNPLKRPSMEIIHSCFESGLPLPLEPQDDSDATTENVGGAEADPPDAVEDLPSDQSQHTEQPTSDDYKRVAIIRTPSPNEYSVANTSHIIKAEAKIGRIGDGEQRSSMGSDPAKLAKTVESGVSNDQSKSTLTSSYYVSALFFTLIASLCANLYLVSQKADPRTLVS
ncbi:hypothetical protein FRB90_000802 [Tulasnella sp. 427]|nr:hypothetical protein FRB90_000802 [Tulasnella sp. 427]